jgi:ribonuclease Z
MLTTVTAGPYTITGVSVGGVYTSLLVKELAVILDAGASPRSFVGGRHLLISHAHPDHVGALPSLIGMRGLSRSPTPEVLLPRESHEDVALAMDALIRAQHRPVQVQWVPMGPGEEHALSGDILVRTFRTRHTIPSLGYIMFRRIRKLRPEHRVLDADSIRARRLAGEDLFFTEERLELAYATDTLVDVLDEHPELFQSRVLVLECTFLDGRKTREEARERGHVHLDEILDRAALFRNEAVVLMHFSQTYAPGEVHRILRDRCPKELLDRLVVFAPETGQWPG